MVQPSAIQTPARTALNALVDGGAWSQHGLARALFVAQPTVRSWLVGVSRPEPHLREALEIVTGIPAADWETGEERAHVERVRTEQGADRPVHFPRPLDPKAKRVATGPAPAARSTPRAPRKGAA